MGFGRALTARHNRERQRSANAASKQIATAPCYDKLVETYISALPYLMLTKS
jgi:hypothetical protein